MKARLILILAAVLPLAACAADALKNGGVWYDTNGYPINAHGGSIVWARGR